MFGGQDQLRARIAGGEHIAAHGREWRGDGDPTRYTRFDHVEGDDRTERIAGHPDVVVQTRQEVDRGRHVEAFGFAAVVFARTVADTAEVETKAVETDPWESVEQGADHWVEPVAAVQRMGMGDRNRSAHRLIGGRRDDVGLQFLVIDRGESHGAVRHGNDGTVTVVAKDHVEDDKLPIKMLNDRLLVRIPDKEGERRSSGGILIPATAQLSKRLVWAEVVALGQNVRSAEVGDRVLFSPEDRYEVEVQGADYIMLRERDLHAVAASRIESHTGLYL
ncbi:MAG: hypothetical protein RLZZ269_1028 [Actinomycetota bacterium]